MCPWCHPGEAGRPCPTRYQDTAFGTTTPPAISLPCNGGFRLRPTRPFSDGMRCRLHPVPRAYPPPHPRGAARIARTPTFQPATLGPTRHTQSPRGLHHPPLAQDEGLLWRPSPSTSLVCSLLPVPPLRLLAVPDPVAPILATPFLTCQQWIFACGFSPVGSLPAWGLPLAVSLVLSPYVARP